MQLITDNRGVSEVVGAVLVFGLLISLMAMLQAYAVPAANAEVEFDHNQEVQGDLAKFHERASRVALHGSQESVSIRAGTGYPTRMLFFNPPRAAGTVSTSDPGEAELQNVQAKDEETADYLDGRDITLDSRTFEYRVRYNELDEAPTTRYEYGILYNQYRDSTINQNPGSVIDDTNINLVFMAGNYSRTSSQAQSIDVRPVSAPARSVSITGADTDENITLVLPTEMPVEEWRELYGDQDTVVGISEGPDPDTVQIDLKGDETYSLRMAGIALEQGVEKPEPYYIVPADDGVETVAAGQTTSAIYEVRDRYNNPVAGANVTIDGGPTKSTNSEGRVSASVTPTTGGNLDVEATLETSECQSNNYPRCEATFHVQSADISINPASGVVFETASVETANVFDAIADLLDPGNPRIQEAEVTFNATSSTSIDQVRVNHYQDNDGDDQPTNWYMSDGSETIEGDVSGDFQSAPSNFDDVDSSGTTYHFQFATDDSAHDVAPEDFFIVTITFDNGQRSTYFVSPDEN